MNLPNILVCAPTAAAKNYCAERFISNVKNLTYPKNKYSWVFVDNTLNNPNQLQYLEGLGFNPLQCQNKNKSVIERMAASHQQCVEYAIVNGYDYILHLETDVFPPMNVIERLLMHKKQVVGGLYYRDEGKFRKLMVQFLAQTAANTIQAVNMLPDQECDFVDGKLKRVASVGLGCVLINIDIFKRIKFRFEPKQDMHPDSYFAQDCFINRIPIYADTSIICEHENKAWGIYGKDFE
jgi:hypothetical protein